MFNLTTYLYNSIKTVVLRLKNDYRLNSRSDFFEQPLLVSVVGVARRQRKVRSLWMQRHAFFMHPVQNRVCIFIVYPWPVDGTQSTEHQFDT